MRMIELRTVGDELVYVAIDHVVAFMRDSKMISSATFTTVRLVGGTDIQVQETPLDIINKVSVTT